MYVCIYRTFAQGGRAYIIIIAVTCVPVIRRETCGFREEKEKKLNKISHRRTLGADRVEYTLRGLHKPVSRARGSPAKRALPFVPFWGKRIFPVCIPDDFGR